MLKQLLLFEQKYQFRQYTFIGSAILFLLLGLVLPRGGYGGDEVFKNAPYVISAGISLLSMSSLLAITLFTANIVLRDSEHKMEELIFTTRINKFQYVASRFLGLFSAGLMVLLASLLGMMMATLLLDKSQLGTFVLWNYLWPFLVFAVPNVLFCTTLLYATAVITRSTMATYIAGVLIYILYLVGSMLGNSPLMANADFSGSTPELLPVLLDPFGLTSFFGETKHWSVIDRNTLLLPLKGSFLLNRLLWLSISMLILLSTYQWFSFRLVSKNVGKKAKTTRPSVANAYKTTNTDPDRKVAKWQMLKSVVILEVKSILKSPAFYVIVLLWLFLMGTELTETLFHQLFGISLYPVTGYIVEFVRNNSLAVIIIIFFSGEITWRERTAKVYELIDVTPASNFVFFVGKSIAILMLIGTFISSLVLTGVVIQGFKGYNNFDIGTYLSLFYYSGLPLFLMGVLSLFIQTVSPNKYLGLLFTCIVFGITLFSARLGIAHYLLRYAVTPELEYAELNGFSYFATAFNWYMVYWTAFAAILSILLLQLWKRGVQSGWRKKLSVIAFRKNTSFTVSGSLALFLISGGFIYYQTNIVHPYMTPEQKTIFRADYEKKYKRYSELPTLTIIDVKTNVDLFPAERYYKVKGWYSLENKNKIPVNNLLVWLNQEAVLKSLVVEQAESLEKDDRFNHYWFKLKKPLQPGERITMEFSIEVAKPGFEKFNKENYITKGGSYIELEKYLPAFGYATQLELEDSLERSKNGLAPQVKSTPANDQYYNWVQYESTISTDEDEQVISIGDLQQQWIEKGRRHYSYKTSKPIPFMFAIASANYEIISYNYKGVSVNLYCKQKQNANVTEMLKAVNNSLDYYSQSFSPYQYKYLRVVEIPHYKGNATAYPGVLFCGEKYNFLSDYRDSTKINYAYCTITHEMAHQWWAGQLAPADAPGAKVLTETLAQYSETLLLEKKCGRKGLSDYLSAELNFYLNLRGYSGETEQALAKVEGQNHVAYQKGGLVMYALKDLVGEEKINQALQKLLTKFSWPNKKATVADLLKELYAVTPSEYNYLINEWFNKVVLYDLKIHTATCRKLANGKFETTARVGTKKIIDNGDGKIVPLSFKEPLKLLVTEENSNEWSKSIYVNTLAFTGDDTVIKIITDKKPGSIIIDPYITRIEQDKTDNELEITMK